MIIRALLRFLVRTRWSSGMAVLGMMLGVTSIVAVHLVSVQVARQLDSLVPSVLQSFSYTAHKDELAASDYFKLLRSQDLTQLRIDGLVPVIDESVTAAGQRLRVVGVDMLDYSGIADEREIDNDIDNGFAKDVAIEELWQGVLVGPDVPDLGRPLLGSLMAPGVVVADIGVAQEILGWAEDDRLSYVGVSVASGWPLAALWLDRLFPGSAAAIPEAAGPQLPGYRVQPTSAQHPARKFGDAVLFNVSALGGLALVVAWFLIYQVAVFWVRRLAPVFDRLFVIGVDQRVLMGYFIGLLATVGVIAALGGLMLGKLLATQLMLASVGQSNGIALDVWVVGKALTSALVVCVFGGGWAFVRAVAPGFWNPAWWVQTGVLIGMLALVGVGLFFPATDLVGGFGSIALLSVFLVFLIPPLLRAVKRSSLFLRGSYLLRMSLREVVWFPRDLSIALAGLSLAIASAIGVGLMVDSFRSEFSAMLDLRLNYDYVIEGDPSELSRLQHEVVQNPLMDRVQVYAERQIRILDTPVKAVVTNLDRQEAQRYGYNKMVETEEMLVSEQLAILHDIAMGDRLEVFGSTYRVVKVFKSFGDLTPTVIVSGTPDKSGAQVSSLRLNASPEELHPYMERFAGLAWQEQRGVREIALRTFDQTFIITSILVAIAIGVGGIGVYIAVTVLRLNQQASQKLLEFMGLSRLEMFGIDLARGSGVGALACVLAIPLGLIFGWILCAVINPRAFGWFVELQISFQAVVVPVAWGMCAAILAGLTRVGQREGDAHG